MESLKYLLFLGCTIPYRVSNYEVSTRKVLKRLGVELYEMPEYNCCGLPMDSLDHELMLTLSARNICVAEREGLNILTLCNGCFGALNKTNKMLKENKGTEKVMKQMKDEGFDFKGTIKVKHLIHVLAQDVGYENIKKNLKKPLNKLRVAQHTGCHILRPTEQIGQEDPENPTILKELIKLTEAQIINYKNETDCCANPIIGLNEEIPFQIAKEKLSNIKAVDAHTLVTVCPFCHIMYDSNQSRIERAFNEKFGIAVLHYPQLLGLSMGFTPEELGINELRVNPRFLKYTLSFE